MEKFIFFTGVIILSLKQSIAFAAPTPHIGDNAPPATPPNATCASPGKGFTLLECALSDNGFADFARRPTGDMSIGECATAAGDSLYFAYVVQPLDNRKCYVANTLSNSSVMAIGFTPAECCRGTIFSPLNTAIGYEGPINIYISTS